MSEEASWTFMDSLSLKTVELQWAHELEPVFIPAKLPTRHRSEMEG